MECVPEIGNLRAVASSNQIAEPVKLDRHPNISSSSNPSYKETSKIPFRIVSETFNNLNDYSKLEIRVANNYKKMFTLYPINTAPAISKIVARRHA